MPDPDPRPSIRLSLSAPAAMTDPEADDLEFLVELLSYVDPTTGKKRVAGGMGGHVSKHHGCTCHAQQGNFRQAWPFAEEVKAGDHLRRQRARFRTRSMSCLGL